MGAKVAKSRKKELKTEEELAFYPSPGIKYRNILNFRGS